MPDVGVALPDERAASNSYQMFLSVEPDGDVISRAIEQLSAWLREKNWDAQLNASTFQQDSDGDRDLLTLHRESSDGREFRARLTERTPDTGAWRTQMTVQVPASSVPWIALQVSNSEGRWTAVPRLARYLLDSLVTKDGSTVLSSNVRIVGPGGVEDLLAEICDPDRQGLLFVAGSSDVGGIDLARYAKMVGSWTQQVQGLAQVAVSTPDATQELLSALGPDHGVRPWTLRTFYPDVDPAIPSDGLRHRFLTTRRLAEERDAVIRQLLGRTVRRHAALRTPPSGYVRTDRALRRLENQMLVESISVHLPKPDAEALNVEVPDTVAEFLAQAAPAARTDEQAPTVDDQAAPAEPISPADRDDLAPLLATIEMVRESLGVPQVTPEAMRQVARQLRQSQLASQAVDRVKSQLEENELRLAEAHENIAALQALYEEAQLDERIAAEDASKRADQVLWLQSRLAAASDFEAAHGAVPEEAYTKYPDDFGDLYLRLPELAGAGVIFTGDKREMLALDEYDTLGKLVNSAWDAFLALADYIRARGDGACDGNVKQYLMATPQGYRSIPRKKFGEKETGATMAQWGDLREFPVPEAVAPSGVKVMEAHFKLGKVGMVSPRMYYLDCWGTHHEVYVGYVGAHLRNTQTN